MLPLTHPERALFVFRRASSRWTGGRSHGPWFLTGPSEKEGAFLVPNDMQVTTGSGHRGTGQIGCFLRTQPSGNVMNARIRGGGSSLIAECLRERVYSLDKSPCHPVFIYCCLH